MADQFIFNYGPDDGPSRSFADFYSTNLVWSVGARLSYAELQAGYDAWATEHRRLSLTAKDLRREMGVRGHRHLLSNGARYLDVRRLGAGEAAPPPRPVDAVGAHDAARLVGALDDAIRALRAAKRAIARR